MNAIASLDYGKVLLGSLIILGFYYFIRNDGSTLEKNIQAKKQQVSQLDVKFLKKEQEYQKYMELEGKLKKQNDKFGELSELMPSTFTEVQLLKLLSKEARTAGLEIIGVRGASRFSRTRRRTVSRGNAIVPTPLKELGRFGVIFDLKGTYTQFLVYLSYLSKIGRVITMEGLSMTGQSSGSRGIKGEDPTSEKIISFKGTFVSYKLEDAEVKAK